jgi:hypothetical protein
LVVKAGRCGWTTLRQCFVQQQEIEMKMYRR